MMVGARAVASRFATMGRYVHTAPQACSPAIKDRFKEMIEDRTASLFRTLNVDPTSDAPLPPVPQPPLPPLFNTQEIYTQLTQSGLSAGKASTLLAILKKFTNAMAERCKEQSVPISASANETYLFDAASSEIRDEITLLRQSSVTSFRSQLARLQRDVEILDQESMEMATLLKADLDMEVHERKNATRDDENAIAMKIHDLSNKISTRLNSELKSEIENLRWQITRRSLTSVALIAAGILYFAHFRG